jgi:UDP-sulfoquinovose synthase
MLGVPMTIYGDGKHQRAFLSLNDSIQALMIAVNNPATPGKVQTWNQLSEWHSILDVAKMVKKVIGDASIKHIDSPRREYTGKHYYNYKTDNLTNLGYSPTSDIFDEISYMIKNIDLVDKKDILLDVVQPKIMF